MGSREAVVVAAVRTPVGRLGGGLPSVRPDDLAAHVIAALLKRAPGLDPAEIADVYLGCANQAGEDNQKYRADGAPARRIAPKRSRLHGQPACARPGSRRSTARRARSWRARGMFTSPAASRA